MTRSMPRVLARIKRALVVMLVISGSAIAVAQPSPDLDDPWGPPTRGSGSSAGSAAPGPGPDPAPGTGSQASPGTGSQAPGTGSQATPGTGSQGSGDPNAPGTGSGAPGTGSQGSGAGTGSAAGSGSGSGPRIIQVPNDVSAPTVSAAASPTVVRLGNKFTVFITATFGAGVEVNLREPLELGSAFEVVRRLSEDKPTGDGRTQREWQLEVIAWELGDLTMPGIAVTYTTMGKANQVATNQVKLRVEGVLGDVVDDPKAMRADAPPTDLLARDWFWLYVAIGGAAGLTILIGLIAYLRARKRRGFLVGGAIAVPRKFDSASDRALHKLMEIEESGILDRDDDRKKGYAQMVEVIREYVGSRHVATRGGDLTTSELMKKLDGSASREERVLIAGWLERCDIVKYGGFKASATDAKKTLEDARALVVTTSQMPANAPAVEAKAEIKPESPKPEPPSPEPPSPEPPSPE
ncbi:MAG: hypothetical protein H0V17_31865, partial [Deltaproteobacteria bacterium]|nr:hypothetical protein [Deltaproteobacteria bacterium]